jgi:hypothetical protein
MLADIKSFSREDLKTQFKYWSSLFTASHNCLTLNSRWRFAGVELF